MKIKETMVYVDGYNLYYGLVKNTPFKWLNLISLFNEIINIQNPQTSNLSIIYFTAPVLTRFSRHKEKSQASQNRYHRALEIIGGSAFKIFNGYFDAARSTLPIHQNPIVLNDKASVWKLEEKQTDVNIALQMYRDASKGEVEQQILVSNDSDLVPAMRYIRKDFPSIQLGLVLPKRKNLERKNASLAEYAHWIRRHVRDEELLKHQLPNMIPTNKKPIYKPKYW